MNRAFVALEIKALDDDERVIEGVASASSIDRMGDIVLPEGAKYDLPLPFLLDHDHEKVVGEVEHVEIGAKQIKFRARIKKIAEPGPVKDLVDTAWSLIKNGLRRAVSIGFRPLDFEVLPNGGLKFTEWDWYELSAVGIPAQPDARITNTKSYSLGEAFVAEVPADPEIPEQPKEVAATGKTLPVVKLGDTARDRAPFVITKIHPERKRA